MKRYLPLTIIALALAAWALPTQASAAEEYDKYGLEGIAARLSDRQAGAHPDMSIEINLTHNGNSPYANTRDAEVTLPPGMVGNPKAVPTCATEEFTTPGRHCPFGSQVGVTKIRVIQPIPGTYVEPVYNMPAAKGTVARLAFVAAIGPAYINVRLDPETHELISTVEGVPSASGLSETTTTLWGVPSSPVHRFERITPQEAFSGGGPPEGREVNLPEKPFLVNPTECNEQRHISVTVRSYQRPEQPSTMTAPFPEISGCGRLGFKPTASMRPTTAQATSGSGLEYDLSLPSTGLEVPGSPYDSELKRDVVTLPEGMTINPSEAEGLGVCSEADLARETFDSAPNVGCPETSKIGSVEAVSPVLDQNAEGSLFLAKPYENPFGSLLALYMVLKIPDRGVLVKLPGEVRLNPATGQITTLFDDIPQLPVSTFHLSFREGARAPLVTPYSCGSYEGISSMTPWASPSSAVPQGSAFAIESGPDHGPCPTGGLPPFKPGLIAGMVNNAAGSYSPFDVRLFRTDAEQEITHFSIKLPRGLVAKLAGIPFCSDAAIAAAKARSGTHGGEEELAFPSCPAASQIGTTLVGSGVGDVLVYVPGKVYLAGPYRGSPLSIVAVTAAKAGPFDLGTVVVREALQINPETAEVFVDATGSDPIPHIIRGVPVHLRDIRVYVDRPEFALNPTDCTATSTASTVRGAGLNFVSEADDNPVTVATRFQAADCAALGFKPQLKLTLKGGTKRNQVPALRAVLNARRGDANISKAEVILPHSEFLEQGHIGTVCTRAQFAAGAGNGAECPAASVYGRARAVTPLLSEPLEGPVFLRSNGGERSLPDLVAALHGQEINIDLVGYIDSVSEKNKNGEVISRIRNRFATVPDAPVTKFVLEMKGGKKGLLVNSTNICRGKHRADANFSGQNGRERDFRPALQAKCGHSGSGKKRAAGKRGGTR